MTEETALLEEFIESKPKKGKLFDALISSSVAYIISIVIFFALQMKTTRFSFKTLDWQLLLVILVLPFFGCIFLINSKRIGWIINSLYFLFISSIGVYSFLRSLASAEGISMTIAWRPIVLIGLALTSTTLLFSKPMRKYYRVTTALALTVFGISISAGIALIVATSPK
jgi:hypothetical protein